MQQQLQELRANQGTNPKTLRYLFRCWLAQPSSMVPRAPDADRDCTCQQSMVARGKPHRPSRTSLCKQWTTAPIIDLCWHSRDDDGDDNDDDDDDDDDAQQEDGSNRELTLPKARESNMHTQLVDVCANFTARCGNMARIW